MRIAIIFPFSFAATIPSLMGLVNFLGESGVKLDFYTCSSKDFPQVAFKGVGVSVHSFPIAGQTAVPRVLRFVTRFFRTLAAHKYDLIVGVDPEGLSVAALMGYLKRVPCVYLSYEIRNGAGAKSLKTKLLKALERWAHPRAVLTIAQDPIRLAELFASNGLPVSDDISLVPNSPRGHGVISKSDFLYSRLGIPKSKVLLLHAGALAEYTMVEDLAASMRSAPPEWALVLHAKQVEDPGSDVLRSLNSNPGDGAGIHLSLSPVASEQVDDLYGSADIGIALYKPISLNVEKMGLSSGKIAHYLRHGKPVVVSDLPFLRDIIEKYKCGICVKSPAEVPSAVLKILESYQTYQQNAVLCYSEIFDIERPLEELLAKMRGAAGAVDRGVVR